MFSSTYFIQLRSGSDEEIKSKISAAKMLVQQHNEAYKDNPTDSSNGKNRHWNENAIVDLIKKADAKLQKIAQKDPERDVRKPLEDAVKSKNLNLLFAALKQAEQKNFTHLQAYTDAKAAITSIIDDDLQRAINLDYEKTLRYSLTRAENNFSKNGIAETSPYLSAKQTLDGLPLRRAKKDLQAGLSESDPDKILFILK